MDREDLPAIDEDYSTHEDAQVAQPTKAPTLSNLVSQHSERRGLPAITFNGLGYRVQTKRWKRCRRETQEKVILEGATGALYYGNLVALMGGSGAGKSSLLDLLASRKDPHNVVGEIRYDGRVRRRLLSSDAAYVVQSDMAMPNLTVFETLMFAANFQLNCSHEDKVTMVNSLLAELRLEHVSGTRVGSSLDRGISGGEFRRLTIAECLLTSPKMIFLDEPTSGLDSASAMVVISMLKKLAETRNQLIVVSIHQPSPALLNLFDVVAMLAKSTSDKIGRVAYLGPVQELNSYPPSVGIPIPPQFEHNVSELLMEITTRQNLDNEVDAAMLEAESGDTWQCPQVDLSSVWAESAMGTDVRNRTLDHIREQQNRQHTAVDEEHRYPTGRWNQFKTFSHRLILNTTRQRGFYVSRFGVPHFVGFFASSLYARFGTSDQDLQNVVSLLFFCLLTCFLMAQVFLPLFIILRPLTARERQARLYSASAMVFGTIVPNMPVEIVNFISFSTYVYWIVGLRIDGYYWFCWLVNFIGNGCLMSFFMMFVSSISATPEVALAIAPIMFMFCIMFCGFFILIDTIPVWFRYWAPYISPIRYSLAVGLYTQFHGVVYRSNCTSSGSQAECRFPTGDKLLDFYGVPLENDGAMWGYIVIVYAFAFAFLVGIYLSNRFRKWQRG